MILIECKKFNKKKKFYRKIRNLNLYKLIFLFFFSLFYLSINDNIHEDDVMNNINVNNNKKKSKRLINKKNKIEDPMDVLVYRKKISGTKIVDIFL